MSIEQRRHIRFSLDLPAVRYTKFGEKLDTTLYQISIGGCLMEYDESVFTGDELRIEIPLPNENRLPLYCKVLYKMEDVGIGAKFLNITRFEQELLAKIITESLKKAGLPVQVSPFDQPSKYAAGSEPGIKDRRVEREEFLDRILSSDFGS